VRRDETRARKSRSIPFVMATKKYDDGMSDDIEQWNFDDEEKPINKTEVSGGAKSCNCFARIAYKGETSSRFTGKAFGRNARGVKCVKPKIR